MANFDLFVAILVVIQVWVFVELMGLIVNKSYRIYAYVELVLVEIHCLGLTG
jgi:hypothetical protein